VVVTIQAVHLIVEVDLIQRVIAAAHLILNVLVALELVFVEVVMVQRDHGKTQDIIQGMMSNPGLIVVCAEVQADAQLASGGEV